MLFQRKVAFFGLFNSLAQVLLKMTVPGVPDFYQGTELWDYSLVDPDNRRPVDYSLRKRQLADLQRNFLEGTTDPSSLIRNLLQNYQSGKIKQFLIWKVLEFRRQHRTLFEAGNYIPLDAIGAKREHVCAFGRTHGTESIIVVAARLVLGLTRGAQRGALESDVWQGTSITIPETGRGPLIEISSQGKSSPLRGRLARWRFPNCSAYCRPPFWNVSREQGARACYPAAGIAAAKFRVRSLRPLDAVGDTAV